MADAASENSLTSSVGGTLGNAVGKVKKGVNDVNETVVSDFISDVEKGLNIVSARFNNWFNEIVHNSGTMGQNVYNAMNAVETASKAISDRHLGTLYNFGMKEYMNARNDYQTVIQRRMEISDSDIEKFAALNKAIGKTGENGKASVELASKLAGQYERYGASISKLTTGIGKTYSEASKSGLNMENITKNIENNIESAAEYGFKNGIDGLQKMAIYAEKIGISIETAKRSADRLQDLSSAAEAAGKLSALGGNFATMSNPLEMMYDSFNDVEDLQKKIGSMVQGMAHFDYNTGQMSINAVDRMRMKQAAEAMGMNSDELIKSAMMQGKQQFISSQFGDSVSDEIKNLIANVGTIQETEEGSGNYEAGAVIKGQFYNAGEIAANEDLQEELRKSQFTDSENLSDIAANTRGIYDKLQGTDIDLNASIMSGQRAIAEKTYNAADMLPDNEFIKKGEEKIAQASRIGYGKVDEITNAVITGVQDGIENVNLNSILEKVGLQDFAENYIKETSTNTTNLETLNNSIVTFNSNFNTLNSNISKFFNNNGGTPAATSSNNSGNATGGYIGGKPHSEGGTHIIAERGEFIVNRNTMNDPFLGSFIEGANRAGTSGPVNNGDGYYANGGYIGDNISNNIKNVFSKIFTPNNGESKVIYVKFDELSGNIGINGNIGSDFNNKQKDELRKIILSTIEDKLNTDKVQKTGIGIYNG